MTSVRTTTREEPVIPPSCNYGGLSLNGSGSREGGREAAPQTVVSLTMCRHRRRTGAYCSGA